MILLHGYFCLDVPMIPDAVPLFCDGFVAMTASPTVPDEGNVL
jgi:hypothetical protein